MFLLKCTDARRLNDEQGPHTILVAEVVRPKEAFSTGSHALEYVMVDCWELKGSYIPSGPLDLTPYPDGGRIALTVFTYDTWAVLHGPVLFLLTIREASFDPSPFVGGVYVAEGRAGGQLFEPFQTRPSGRIPEHAHRVSLAQLGLPAALIDRLESEGISTAGDLCLRTTAELLEIRNLGNQQLQEVQDRLAEAGLRLWEEEAEKETS